MTDGASPPPCTDPTDAGAGLDLASGTGGIDPDDTEIVPAALMGMVTSARTAYGAIQANGCYPAIMAIGAVEDTVAALERISFHLWSSMWAITPAKGAGQSFGQVICSARARSVLSEARHRLALDRRRNPNRRGRMLRR